MQGKHGNAASLKSDKPGWDASLHWPSKSRGEMGLVSHAEAQEGLPAERNKSRENGFRAEPIQCTRAWDLRRTCHASFGPLFKLSPSLSVSPSVVSVY